MKKLMSLARACVPVAILAAAAPASAITGQLSFGASTMTVNAGDWVDFSLSYSATTYYSISGGSNPIEPAPVEGYQDWYVNWYSNQAETLRYVSIDAGGQSFSETLEVPPDTSHSNSWSFSMLFPDAGSFDIVASGQWSSDMASYNSAEYAWRDCVNVDPGGSNELSCSSWTYEYQDFGDNYLFEGSFDSQVLHIEVLAVPEAPAWALWSAGLAVLGLIGRRRRRA